MSELGPEPREVGLRRPRKRGSGVAIALIIAAAAVALGCIAAFTAIMFVFFQNPPW